MLQRNPKFVQIRYVSVHGNRILSQKYKIRVWICNDLVRFQDFLTTPLYLEPFQKFPRDTHKHKGSAVNLCSAYKQPSVLVMVTATMTTFRSCSLYLYSFESYADPGESVKNRFNVRYRLTGLSFSRRICRIRSILIFICNICKSTSVYSS